MNIPTLTRAAAHILLLVSAPALQAQVPQILNYQGRIAVDSVNFDGSGQFKFALVNAGGTTTHWSHDGTSTAGSEPSASVTLPVTKGLYSVLLGDLSITGMTSAIPASIWDQEDLRLRVWFNDGVHGFQHLKPDQRLAPNGYLPDQGVSNAKLIHSTVKVTAGTGLTGGGTVALGGSMTLSADIGTAKYQIVALDSNGNLPAVSGEKLTQLDGNNLQPSTVKLSALESDSVDSSKIVDKSIVDADISFTAGIQDGKLATISSAGKVANSATSADVANIQKTLVVRDSDGSFSSESIRLDGNLDLPATDSSGKEGVISRAGIRLIHTYGGKNFFAGLEAGNLTMTGTGNTATGYRALLDNSTGNDNTATGYLALSNNANGIGNTATGNEALLANTSGKYNTAVGDGALRGNTDGDSNIAIGRDAGNSLTDGDNNIAIGNTGVAGESNTIRIGTNQTKTYLAGRIYGDGSKLTGIEDIANFAVDTPQIANHAVTNMQIAPGTIATHNLASNLQFTGTTAGNFYGSFAGQSNGISFASNAFSVGTSQLVVADGNVGIGTATPTKAKLEVVGSDSTSLAAGYRILSNGGAAYNAGSQQLAVHADSQMAASAFYAFSDERIKDIVGRSDSAADLGTLRHIEITDYHYKDVIEKGARRQKKVIAQQVEDVFPQAVSRTTDVVPDIFQEAVIHAGWVELSTDLKVGERVRLITENGRRVMHEVLEIGAERFRINLTGEDGKVFVYGREVDDFRSVDYEAIAMLNVSATQELARQLEAQQAENTELKKQLAEQAGRNNGIEARLAALEQYVPASAATAVKVALKK